MPTDFEPIECCSACGYGPTLGVKDSKSFVHSGHPTVDLCRVCYTTFSANVLYRNVPVSNETVSNETVLKVLAQCTNIILAKLERLEAQKPKRRRNLCCQCGHPGAPFIENIGDFCHSECQESYMKENP